MVAVLLAIANSGPEGILVCLLQSLGVLVAGLGTQPREEPMEGVFV
jgi:hypothetical protein